MDMKFSLRAHAIEFIPFEYMRHFESDKLLNFVSVPVPLNSLRTFDNMIAPLSSIGLRDKFNWLNAFLYCLLVLL